MGTPRAIPLIEVKGDSLELHAARRVTLRKVTDERSAAYWKSSLLFNQANAHLASVKLDVLAPREG
jgi:hypothetical protein